MHTLTLCKYKNTLRATTIYTLLLGQPKLFYIYPVNMLNSKNSIQKMPPFAKVLNRKRLLIIGAMILVKWDFLEARLRPVAQ
ncbi:MAG: hypothetical protein ACI9LE_002213 [Paraglaciecola sp.]|jgi:hypothetical protein